MKLILILILLPILYFPLLAEDATSDIYLKNKTILSVNLIAFKKWGIITSEHKTINYKTIAKIETNSLVVVDSLKKNIENLLITKKGSCFFIDFSKANIPILFSNKIIPINYLFYSVGYSSEKNNNFNSVLEMSPALLNGIIIREGFATKVTSANRFDNMGFYFGTGYLFFDHGYGVLSATVNFRINSNRSYSDDIFLSLNYKYNFTNFYRLILFTEMSYIVNKQGSRDDRDKINYLVGIGLNLSQKK